MKQLLIDNYKLNPNFDFGIESWSLDRQALESFSILYGNSREKTTKKQERTILNLLQNIFFALENQASDRFEIAFLKELHHELKMFFDAEFKYRRKLQSFSNDSSDARSNEIVKSKRFYGCLSEKVLDEVQTLMETEIDKFRTNAKENKLKRSDLSVNRGETIDQINKMIGKEFREQGIFEIVSNYVGIKYETVGVSLELSVEGSSWWKNNHTSSLTPKTMYAHLDESIYAPKSIIYLSDVSAQNGPTSSFTGIYEKFANNPLQDALGRVIGNVGNRDNSELKSFYDKPYHQSFASEKFRRHFMRLPSELRFNSHLGWDILPGTSLENLMVTSEEVLTGCAGTFVVFDGSMLLHRGGLIEKGERIVLQVVFSQKAKLITRAFFKIKHFIKDKL